MAVKLDSAFIKLCVCVKKSNFLSWAIRTVFVDPVTNKDASNSVSQTVSSSSDTTQELVSVVVQSSDATSEVSVVASSDATPSTTHMTSSSINSPVMYSTTGTYNTIETYSAQSLPMTNMGYTASLGPPPLIQATPQEMPRIISSQRPVISTLSASRSLYEAQINTRSHVISNPLINALPTMPTRNVYEPLAASGLSFTTPVISMHSTIPSHQSQMFATSRFPKLTLPMFSGDPLTWQTFWDSFYVSVHANPNLSGIQKFNYLKAQLQGDAARTIAGLPLTDLNYGHAIALLEDRFGQHHKIVKAHMQAFLEIPAPSNTLASLRIFYDTVESHIWGLSSLGKSEQSYGDLLIPILMGKLSTDIQRNLPREHSNSAWNLPDLMAAILKEIQILESGLCDPHRTMPKSTAASLLVSSRDNPSKKHGNPDGKRKQQCVFCNGGHPAHNCDVVTDCKKRLDIVKGSNLCFNCLAHHRVSHCPSKFRCRKCKKKHHTSLCNSESSPEIVAEKKSTPDNTPTTTAGLLTPTSCCETPQSMTCLLKTAVAPVIAGNVKTQANILFDEGAQRSFISEEMASELQITPTSTADIAVASFGTTSSTPQKLGVATVSIETESGELISVSVLIVPSIAAPIQNSVSASVYNMPHLHNLKLAHPVTSERNFAISLLIGADYYWTFVQDTIVRGDGPTAQESKLGYLLSGPLPYSLSQTATSILLQMASTVMSEEPNLEKFWSIESVGIDAIKQAVNSTFLRTYQQSSITQTPEGMYVARFPWKEDKPFLPSNITIFKKQTTTLLQKLKQTPDLLNIYDNIIKDQEKRGFIERVDDNDTIENTHYHPIVQSRRTLPQCPSVLFMTVAVVAMVSQLVSMIV